VTALVRRCYVQWDYDMFPLRGDIDDEQIASLPAELRERLQLWSDDGSDLMWGPDGPDRDTWTPPAPEPLAKWARRGRQLRAQVAEVLGEEWLVGYFDEDSGEIDWRT
jgi:hypothetical protein